MDNFTFADGLLLAVDLKRNNAMCGRDRLRELTGLSDSQAKKIVNMVRRGFADYFFSEIRKRSFVKSKKFAPVKERMANITDSDLANFAKFGDLAVSIMNYNN